jgi:hypothetical protein
MDRHVRALSVLYIAGGIAGAILGIISLFMMGSISNLLIALFSTKRIMSVPFAAIYLTAVAWVSVLVAIPAVISGWGLRGYHDWARMMGMVVAVMLVVSFPVGSLIGLYAIWVLLSPETEYLFLEPPERRATTRR